MTTGSQIMRIMSIVWLVVTPLFIALGWDITVPILGSVMLAVGAVIMRKLEEE